MVLNNNKNNKIHDKHDTTILPYKQLRNLYHYEYHSQHHTL